jgi:hypothetical protein
LQYFNLKNTIEDNSNAFRILLVKDSFIDSLSFIRSIEQKEGLWDKVLYTNNTKDYYKQIICSKADTLYIDNDSSAFLALYAMLLRKKVYVYEEGYGIYRKAAIKESIGKWKFRLYRVLGIDRRIGNAAYLKGIYVYLPEAYRQLFPDYKKEIKPFRQTFMQALRSDVALLKSLSSGVEWIDGIRNESILLYLTSHHINDHIVDCIEQEKEEYDRVYIKPHPHIKDTGRLDSLAGNVIRSNIMVEVLLLLLIDNGNKVTVIHENSTAVLWFQHKIINRNMGKSYEEYEMVASYVKKHVSER